MNKQARTTDLGRLQDKSCVPFSTVLSKLMLQLFCIAAIAAPGTSGQLKLLQRLPATMNKSFVLWRPSD